MRIDVENVSDRLGLVLGASIFLFGFLKLFDPFHTWFQVQIENSGLPGASFVLGITGEIGRASPCSAPSSLAGGWPSHAT